MKRFRCDYHDWNLWVQRLDARPSCLFTHGLTRVIIINFSQIRIPFSAPTGFMVPPLHGVSSAVLCSDILDQGSPFHFRDPSNYSVVVVIWTFVLPVTYTCPVIGARCCKAWGTHPILKTCFFLFFSDSRFVIRAIYLPFLFQPLPRW